MFVTLKVPRGFAGEPAKSLNIHNILELNPNGELRTTVTYMREGRVMHQLVEGSQAEVTEAINALFEREAAAGSHRPSSTRANQNQPVRSPA